MKKWLVTFITDNDIRYARGCYYEEDNTKEDICEKIMKECEENKWIHLNDLNDTVDCDTFYLKTDNIVGFSVGPLK